MSGTRGKILVVTQHFYPENFRINDIVDKLIEDGFDVDVLCGLPNYPKGEWFDGYSSSGPFEEGYHGARVFRSKEIRRRGNTSSRIFLNYTSWPLTAFFRVGSLPGGYSSVFCYNTSPVLMIMPAAHAARKYHVPLVVYVLDIWPENLYTVLQVSSSLLRRIAQSVSDHLYKKADCLISMSDSLKQRLIGRLGQSCPDVEVIPQHAEDFYARRVHDESLCEQFAGKTVFLFAGNFSPAQNLDCVIRAAGKAITSGFTNLHLLLLGDGMSRPSLEELVKEEGLSSAVTFYGKVDAQEIPRFTDAASALIVPLAANKDLELTIPAKVASCMAAGKPIIGSLGGEGAKAIADADCGFVTPSGDEDALCESFLAFQRTSPEERLRMGSNAFAYYQGHFSRERVVTRLEETILRYSAPSS